MIFSNKNIGQYSLKGYKLVKLSNNMFFLVPCQIENIYSGPLYLMIHTFSFQLCGFRKYPIHTRLLPKIKNREPFELLTLQVGSPSHNVGSPHKKSSHFSGHNF